jgi:DNA-binding transcriptional ArsR family regulator
VATDGGRAQQELVRALSHPIRMRILEKLHNRSASPAELSRELNQRVGVIAYHAHTLLRCGCVELVHSEPRRGSVENYFAISIAADGPS